MRLSIAHAGFAMLLTFVPLIGHAQTTMERREIGALTAPEVESLRRGVAKMKERDKAPRDSVDFLRSWEFWSNNHFHFGETCTQGLDTSVPGMAGQVRISAKSAVERGA